MFDRLDAPTDLGSARARLAAEAERRAGSATVHHLGAPAGWSDPGLAEAGVAVADSVIWQASEAQLAALAAALGSERSLLFLEPTADLGWRRLVHRVGRPVWRRVAGHDFETDVPVRLREAGLEVVDVCRFGVGRRQLRSYVVGRAIGFSSR